MCGRTACTLQSDHIRSCCTYKNGRGDEIVPRWIDRDKYYPRYNLGPTMHSPVIISGKHAKPINDDEERILQTMSWGLSVYGTGQMVINARCETLLEKNTFKLPLKAGKRCIVLADGYYEWHRHGKVKDPYLIYLQQSDGISIHDGTWKIEDEAHQKFPNLLKMAGIFDKIKGEEEKMGYVVITVVAAKSVSHIHDRMPAILTTDDAVRNWLDFGKIDVKQALEELNAKEDVKFYRVSTFVNNIRNNTSECIQPLSDSKIKPKGATFLDNWLKRSPQQDEKSHKHMKKELDN